MVTYESTVICSPELPAEKIDELVEKIKKVVETSKGQVLITQQLGKKRLAYPIRKFREGSYVYLELSGEGEMVNALENFFKVNADNTIDGTHFQENGATIMAGFVADGIGEAGLRLDSYRTK